MNNSRSFLVLALLLVSYLVWNQWQQDYSKSGSTPAATADAPAIPVATTATPQGADTPTASAALPSVAANNAAVPTTPRASSAELVEIHNDVLKLWIDTYGANVVRAELLAYPQQPKDYKNPVRLLDNSNENYFVAQSGLTSVAGSIVAPTHQDLFTSAQTSYELADGQQSVEVPFTWQDPASGLVVHKVFVLQRGSYVLATRQEIHNGGTQPWSGNAYRQLQRVAPAAKQGGLTFTNPENYSFVGAAWYSPEDKFNKIAFAKFEKQAPRVSPISAGWIAMLQHYFFAAWLPAANEPESFTVGETKGSLLTRYWIRAMGPSMTVAAGADAVTEARLYIGPKLQTTLNDVAPGLALTVDYGVLTVISEPMHWVLAKLHSLTGNWGFAIILLVLLIKLALFKLSESQFRSMAKMRKLQPRVQAINERYADDRQKKSQAMMELYQKEKINPLGSCLPMVVQIPIFLALYWVLLESVELRHAPFILWIQNLTAPDPYFVLPILNAATMFLTQHLSPTTGMDPMQAKMMKLMPLVFSVMFAFFPSGLVLYWTVNGMSSLLQQWVITKRVEAAEKT
ncbi:MAG: membrane protein insertase YidC [Tahibacter sp.]